MPTLTCSEIKTGRSHEITADWKRTYKRTFRVVTDNPNRGPIAVRSTLPVGIGSRYLNGDSSEFDNGAFVNKISVETEAEDGMSWICAVEYGPWDPTQRPENPLDHPLEIEGGFSPYERIVDRDQDGNAVVNTAGDPFDPPVTMEDPRPVLTIARNEPAIDWSLVYRYRNAVNSDSFWGADPGQVKVSRISPRRVWDQYLSANELTPGGFYWAITYEFEFNPDGWHSKILSQGMRQLVGGVQKPITIGGSAITSPALLDESGALLAVGADPVFIEFTIYPELPYATFNLDNPGP
jgi:hypothetical protein